MTLISTMLQSVRANVNKLSSDASDPLVWHWPCVFKICSTFSLFVLKRLGLSGYPGVVLAINFEQ